MLDGIVSAAQQMFVMHLCMVVFVLTYILYRREKPRLIVRFAIFNVAIATAAITLSSYFAFLASVHLAVGTLNAVVVLSFILCVVGSSCVTSACNKVMTSRTLIVIDLVSVLLLSMGVIFLAQPVEIFGSVAYFQNTHQVYHSVCNSGRFTDLSTGNGTMYRVVEQYKSEGWKGYLFASLMGFCNTLLVVNFQTALKSTQCQDILFWMGCVIALISLPVLLLTGGFHLPTGSLCNFLFLLNTVSNGTLICFLLICMCQVTALDVAVITGFRLPLLFVFQFTFLSSITPAPVNTVAVAAAVLVMIVVVGKPLLQGWLTYIGIIQ